MVRNWKTHKKVVKTLLIANLISREKMRKLFCKSEIDRKKWLSITLLFGGKLSSDIALNFYLPKLKAFRRNWLMPEVTVVVVIVVVNRGLTVSGVVSDLVVVVVVVVLVVGLVDLGRVLISNWFSDPMAGQGSVKVSAWIRDKNSWNRFSAVFSKDLL